VIAAERFLCPLVLMLMFSSVYQSAKERPSPGDSAE